MKPFYLTLCLFFAAPCFSFAQDASAAKSAWDQTEVHINQIARDASVISYPNPCSRAVNFTLDPIHKIELLEIFKITGEQVGELNTAQSTEASLDLSAAPAGMYLFRAISESGRIEVGRFLKN